MKKSLIISAFVLLGLTTVKAQDNFGGVRGGVNFATINSDEFDSFDGRTSFHFGLMYEIQVSDMFSFQPELLYSSQGSDYSDIDFEGTVKLDYLNLPLMAKFYVAEGFSLEAGPQLGFLISAKDEGESDGFTYDEDIKEFIKGLDIGLNLGVGYKLDNGLNFGARYNFGLTDVNDDYEEGGTYKNGVIQISIGYLFF
jgi:hypothetical protein